MFKLDDNLLRELGLGALQPAEKNKMLSHIYETLEMRVGMKLAEQMTNEQLDEFESFIDKNDEAGALRWLETNFPNYKQVVAYQLEALKSEIRQVAPQIIAASNAGQEDNAQTQTNPQVSHIQSQQQFQQPPIPHSDYQNSTDLNVQQQSTIPPDQSPPAPPVNI